MKWLSNDQIPDIRWQSDSIKFRFHVLPGDFRYIHKFSCLNLWIIRQAFACQSERPTDCVLQQWSHVCQTHRLPCVKWFITFYSSSEINIGPCNVVGHVMGGHFWRAYSVFIGECLSVESNFREVVNNSDDSDSFYGRVFRTLVVRLRYQEVFWGDIWNCREMELVILDVLRIASQSKVWLYWMAGAESWSFTPTRIFSTLRSITAFKKLRHRTISWAFWIQPLVFRNFYNYSTMYI